MVKTTLADVEGMRYEEQGAALAAPAAGYRIIYALTRGLEEKDDAGLVRRIGIAYSEANVSDPPSDAELDGEFGTPATVGGGFMAVLNDNGGDTDVWLVFATDSNWYYLQFTQAV